MMLQTPDGDVLPSDDSQPAYRPNTPTTPFVHGRFHPSFTHVLSAPTNVTPPGYAFAILIDHIETMVPTASTGMTLRLRLKDVDGRQLQLTFFRGRPKPERFPGNLHMCCIT